MSAHANSVASLATELSGGRLGRRSAAILATARESGEPYTDRSIMLELGHTDPNAVRPRITELIDMGLLVETGSATDTYTGKRSDIKSIADSNDIPAGGTAGRKKFPTRSSR